MFTVIDFQIKIQFEYIFFVSFTKCEINLNLLVVYKLNVAMVSAWIDFRIEIKLKLTENLSLPQVLQGTK